MNNFRGYRLMKLMAAGVILLQAAGCAFNDFLAVVQTGLLAVTAAGSVAILQNI